MGIREELEAEAQKLRGIKADAREGNGHNFGKSKQNKEARGESTRAEDPDA